MSQPAHQPSHQQAHPQDRPSPNDTYTSPLASRNASPEMLRLWSPRHKFNTWRRIWLAIAQAQHEVTQDWDQPLVSAEQVDELRAVVERGITDEELARASEIERDLRHDVMAHVHCLGEQCPKAKPIIHLGCTSQDVVCNADILCQADAVRVILNKMRRLIVAMGQQSREHAALATLGFTHYQTAQPTTVGRRCASWAYEVALPIERFRESWTTHVSDLAGNLRGFRGATGTQASFLKLFNDDPQLVDRFEATAITALDPSIKKSGYFDSLTSPEGAVAREQQHLRHKAENIRWRRRETGRAVGPDPDRIDEVALGLTLRSLQEGHSHDVINYSTFMLGGQTYPRVHDTFVLSDLASIAAVLHKIATDIRLLSNRKELEEPFGKSQIGSSAMPYKRNPMKCERICGLTRFVMNLVGNAYDTAATQWLERTLDDSSNRRLSLPEAFLALDGALDLMHQVASGLVVNEAMVRKNLMDELPFLATENILMEAVKAGGDRQDLHEKIRVHAQAAGQRVKQEGLDNDLIDRLRNDPAFASVKDSLTEDALLDPMKYVGRSVEQTERFIAEVIEPLRERYADELDRLEASDRGV